MAAYISLNLSEHSHPVFATYVDSITSKMEGNPDFPSPPVPWAGITADMVTYRTYLVDPDLLSPYDRKQRDKLRGIIQGGLKRNGQYAIMLFPNDAVKQQSTGFPPVKTRVRKTQPPNKPTELRVRAGHQSGQAILNCRKQPGTVSINIKVYDNEPDSKPRFIHSPSAQGVIIDGLVPGRQYFFEVQAVGSAGTGDWAGPVDIFAP